MRMCVRHFTVAVLVCVDVLMFVFVRQMHVEFCPGDSSPLLARNMGVIFIETELFQFMFEPVWIDAEIDHCTNEHVATDAAEDIQIEGVHFSSPAASALI
jgi:hypothetical protein